MPAQLPRPIARLVLLLLPLVSTAAPAEDPPSRVARARVPALEAQEIDGKVDIGYGLAIGDVDGDGLADILLADKTDVVWYRNPDWKRFVLCEDVTERDNVCIAARDLDGDGRVEIAIGAQWNPGDTVDSGSVHYLIAPEDRREKWEVVDLPREPTVHRMQWVLGPGGRPRLVVAPLHGRGNRGGQGAGVKVLGYEVPADPRGEWRTELIDDRLHVLHNFEPVNWDGDVEHEVVLAGREGIFLCDRAAEGWRTLQLAGNESGETAFEGASEVRAGVLPDGGRRFIATVEPFHGTRVVVYTPAASDARYWRRRVIADDLAQGHALACADLTGSGSDQLLVGWRERNGEGKLGIRLYIPLDGAGREWERVVVDDGGMACEDIKVHDLDGDGRQDVIAAGRSTHNLKVYWNRGLRR